MPASYIFQDHCNIKQRIKQRWLNYKNNDDIPGDAIVSTITPTSNKNKFSYNVILLTFLLAMVTIAWTFNVSITVSKNCMT